MVSYFIFHALFGDKGLIKYFHLKKELQRKEITQEGLANKARNKQNMVNGMSVESLDLDLLDEEARKNLGYAGKQEIVVYDDEGEKK